MRGPSRIPYVALLAATMLACIGTCSAEDLFVGVPANSLKETSTGGSIASTSSDDDTVLARARSARDPQPSKLPPGDDLSGDGATCWALMSVWPTRTCTKKQNRCAVVDGVVEADACRFCARGYGVYRTEEDCLNAPQLEGENVAGIASTSIDPSSYHEPTMEGSQCWERQTKTDQDACPHTWPSVKLWEEGWIWPNGQVPSAWSAVRLPENTKVLISGCSLYHQDPFFSITIPQSSELIFADAPLHLRVGSIRVEGKLRIGSPSCRTWHPITITFEKLDGLNTFDMGIQVTSTGEVEMHGRDFKPTWTRLERTADQWSDSVRLLEPVSWEPGQLVVVATSIWKDEYDNQNEVMRIKGVSEDDKTIWFDSKLRHHHYGGWEYKTEVGLLSRSIILRGHSGSEWDKKGGHVRVEGQGRFRGVLAYRMGQTNVMSAYPFHFHHIKNYNSYVKDSAVFRSFYRGMVIHGSNAVALIDNVAFHVEGSCYYLEDGVEEDNWLEHNFAAYVHPIGSAAGGNDQTGSTHVEDSSRVQPADAAAACFYSGNLNNVWLRNAASGGFAGFSFPVFPKPIKDFRWKTDFVPHERPLKRFEGNTVHSTGYFWLMTGGIYFGGKLWHNDYDGGKLYYSSGRHESNPRTADGTAESTHVLRNNKAWLAQWAVSHWGGRVTVEGWEADDCTRGANIFGHAKLIKARINGKSDNQNSQFPGRLTDLAPIAGFQWYDASVMTILSDVTFRNFYYQPQLGPNRQSVWHSMVHSDEFKPQHMSTSINIKYENIDWRALVNHPIVSTGGSRYFQWVDWDGSASKTWRPTVMGSWPQWWRADDKCWYKEEWSVWVCDWYPWRNPARLDISIEGYTIRQDSGSAMPPTPENEAGFIAQFGYRYDQKRAVAFTRNEGSVGLTGSNGWYVHFKHGVPKKIKVYPNQIPPGTSIVFATRYPQGTTFYIKRWFKWQSKYTSDLRWANSLEEVLSDPTGERYWFSGKHLYIKMTDPEALVKEPLKQDGAIVWGARFFELSYEIEATSLRDWYCPWKQGAHFCYMQDDENTDIPDALPSWYNSWLEPYCADFPPPDESSCWDRKNWGQCDDSYLTNPDDPNAKALGYYCGVTCGRCQQGEFQCVDRAPTGSLSGGRSCSALKEDCACYEWWMPDGDFCAVTCNRGECGSSPAPPENGCGDTVPPGVSSCEESRCKGQCSQDWMFQNSYCRTTCGLCNECREIQPDGDASCEQRRNWGQCDDSWMKDYKFCARTCGFAPCAQCDDNPPDDSATCAQRKEWGNCYERWMEDGGHCRRTCGFAPCPDVCDDRQPDSTGTCLQRREWGNCDDQWMKDGGFCRRTCGFDPCPAACYDRQPDDSTCAQRKEWGDCSAQWMQDMGYCREACGFEPCPDICDDRQPDDTASCAQRKEWGNCQDQWMKDSNYCARTCGFAPCPQCDDNPPDDSATCAQRKEWGNCYEQWMQDGGHCRRTCGFTPCPAVCDDRQPDDTASCTQRKEWGNCDDQWMRDGGFCRRTCGFDPCPA